MRGKPPGLDRALGVFEGFNKYDAKDIGTLPFSIPAEIYLGGPCVWVTYRSDKWSDGTHDYIHKIESYPRVKCGLVARRTSKRVKVPQRIQGDQTLTMIGLRALGFAYMDDAGDEIEAKTPDSQWFWSSKGRALLAVQEKRKLVAIIWGGDLDVEARGIVG